MIVDKGFCPKCGRPVLQTHSFESFSNGGTVIYQHFTCPRSCTPADLPLITAPPSEYLTLTEGAQLLRVSKSTLRQRIRRGMLPAKRLRGGQTVLVARQSLQSLLDDIGAPSLPPLVAVERQERSHDSLADTDSGEEANRGKKADSVRTLLLDIGGLSDVPLSLLTRRAPDERGQYPGGAAAYKAEAAELDRRTRRKEPVA